MKSRFLQKTVTCLSLLVLLAGLIVASGCTQNAPAPSPGIPTPSPPATTPVTTAPTTLPPPPPPPTTPAATFGVKISSLTCTWTVKTGDYNVKSDCVRIISSGTAEGPVGARLELPILAWSTDKATCGNWTLRSGALIAVGSTCRREAGQPESTTWKVDTGSDNCPLKSYFATSITHTPKIYNDDEVNAQAQDTQTAGCK